jgi:hypothetical protein
MEKVGRLQRHDPVNHVAQHLRGSEPLNVFVLDALEELLAGGTIGRMRLGIIDEDVGIDEHGRACRDVLESHEHPRETELRVESSPFEFLGAEGCLKSAIGASGDPAGRMNGNGDLLPLLMGFNYQNGENLRGFPRI